MLQTGEHCNFTQHPLGWQMLSPCTPTLGVFSSAARAGLAAELSFGPPGPRIWSWQGIAISFLSSICLDEIQPSGPALPHGGRRLRWRATGNIPVQAIHGESPLVQGLNAARAPHLLPKYFLGPLLLLGHQHPRGSGLGFAPGQDLAP